MHRKVSVDHYLIMTGGSLVATFMLIGLREEYKQYFLDNTLYQNIFIGILAFLGIIFTVTLILAMLTSIIFTVKVNQKTLSSHNQKSKVALLKKLYLSFLALAFFSLITFLGLKFFNFSLVKDFQILPSVAAGLSLLTFLIYVILFPSKLVKKMKLDKDRQITDYHLGDWVINVAVSGLLSLLIFIIFPFLVFDQGKLFSIDFNEEAFNNFTLAYIISSFLLIFISLFKGLYKKAALFLFLAAMTIGVIDFGLNYNSETALDNQTTEVANFLTDRSSCDRQYTLQMAKSCTLLVMRDDGGHGSGFVVEPGYLVTNRHVIEGADELSIWWGEDKEVQVWNYSPTIDLAILKLPEDVDASACQWFDSEQLEIAEELYTFGWPNAPSGDSTVTKGIYSRTNRYEDETEDIQTDAPINPGSSGGPLVNVCGVVGINTLRLDWSDEQIPRVIEGMGFAISSNSIHQVVDQLIADGSLNTGIPEASQTDYDDNYYYEDNFVLDITSISDYVSSLRSVKISWEEVRGQVDNDKLNRLIDLFNRQIDFGQHLIDKLSDGSEASAEDYEMWDAIVSMSYEASWIIEELNSEWY